VGSAKEFALGLFVLGCLFVILALFTVEDKKPDAETCPKLCREHSMATEWSYTSKDMLACVCKKLE
jgi:hypothetical protein